MIEQLRGKHVIAEQGPQQIRRGPAMSDSRDGSGPSGETAEKLPHSFAR